MSFLEGGEVAGPEVVFGDPAGSGVAAWSHAGGAPEAVCGWGEAEFEEGVPGVDVDGHPLAWSGLAPAKEAVGSHRWGVGAADLE